jgi:predicted nucleic acid-binding protein
MPNQGNRAQLQLGKSLFAKAILIDTCVLLALANSRDNYHLTASECLQTISKYHFPIYISIPTIYESHRRILFDLGQSAAQRFLNQIYDGSLNIERTVDEDERQARFLIEKYAALKLTLTDAANMSVMLRLGIATAFSFDRHFLQAGFI